MTTACTIEPLEGNRIGLAASMLAKAYADEPIYQQLLHARRPGYNARLRATFRHLLALHLATESPVFCCRNDQGEMVGVASLSSLFLRLELKHHWLWRIKMLLTAGPDATQNYIQYFSLIAAHLPRQNCRVLTSLGVLPNARSQGYGQALLQHLEHFCDQDHENAGLYVDAGAGRYFEFYLQQGFEPYAKLHFAETEPCILRRPALIEAP